ncbi:hypothetical protein Tco_1206903 [Tanacetum coccineum]
MRRVGKDFSGRITPWFPTMVVQNQQEQGEGSVIATNPQHAPTITQPSTSKPKKTHKPKKPKKKNNEVSQPSGSIDNVADEAVNEEMDDSLVKAATTASSLEAEQDSGDIIKTQSKATPNEASSTGTSSGGGPRVKSPDKEDLGEADASKQGRIADIDADAGLPWKSAKLKDDKVVIQEPEKGTTTTTPIIQPKAKGIAFRELGKSTTTTTTISQNDKGKIIMVEEPAKMKKKDQISFDEQVAQRLQAQMQAELEEEEDRLARLREEEGNIALIKEWHNVQAMMDADYQMAQQLQTQEQEKLSIKEKSKLFVQLLEARKKHFAVLRAQEKRNKQPTKAQKRNTMSTYLKNMAGYKQNQLKNKSFDEIQKLFDKAMKRVNTFVEMDTELVEGSSKRTGTELEQEVTKKQKVDDVQETAKVDKDKETLELQSLMEVVPNEKELAIDVIPLYNNPQIFINVNIHLLS